MLTAWLQRWLSLVPPMCGSMPQLLQSPPLWQPVHVLSPQPLQEMPALEPRQPQEAQTLVGLQALLLRQKPAGQQLLQHQRAVAAAKSLPEQAALSLPPLAEVPPPVVALLPAVLVPPQVPHWHEFDHVQQRSLAERQSLLAVWQ